MAIQFGEMTDSGTARSGKRDRLVASASELLHRKGVAATSLADISAAANVPLGNLYYYFRTKDDLVKAVIDTQTDQVDAMLAAFDQLSTPAERIKALVRRWDDMRELIARYGCPFGTLSVELARRDDGLDVEVTRPIQHILRWAEIQFRNLGTADPRDLAITLFAGIQGGALLASALHDPDLMSGQARHLERWIESVTTARPGRPNRSATRGRHG